MIVNSTILALAAIAAVSALLFIKPDQVVAALLPPVLANPAVVSAVSGLVHSQCRHCHQFFSHNCTWTHYSSKFGTTCARVYVFIGTGEGGGGGPAQQLNAQCRP